MICWWSGSVLPTLRKALVLVLVLCLYLVYHHPKYPLDYLNALTPNRVHSLWADTQARGPWWGHVDPPVIPSLRAARWAGSWDVPELRAPKDGDEGAMLVMLHIFSMPSKSSRRRRDLIRRYSPLLAVAEEYRSLVEVKFVLGHPPTRGNETDEEWGWDDDVMLDEEQEAHGDLLRLDGLHKGENMNEGKSWEWLRHVGRAGGGEAWWVIKCDDDTVPILPNLLPWISTLNPTQPTYFGNPHVHPKYHMYYFEGMMYGFSWGVVKTLATADASRWDITLEVPEDDRMGELMYNLPTKPPNATLPPRPQLFTPSDRRPKRPKNVIFPVNSDPLAYYPGTEWVSSIQIPAPDSRTGLVRIDLSHYVGQYHQPWVHGGSKAFAWHWCKSDEAYVGAWERAVRDVQAVGREWRWVVPSGMKWLAAKL